MLRSLRFLILASAASVPLIGAEAEQVVVLKEGVAALKLREPGPQDLSSGAALNLKLPNGTMNAQALASVGREENAKSFWHKDAAQVDAQMQGPFGTTMSASGENRLEFVYRTPAEESPSGTDDRLVRSESRRLGASLSVPVEGARIVVGGERAGTLSQDASGGAADAPVIRTENTSATAKLEWRVLPNLEMEAGAAARTSDITWCDGASRSGSYASVDPQVSVSATPWRGARVKARVERAVSPYDTAAFAAHSAVQPPDTPALQPDHAWQVQVQVEQQIGVARLSAAYTASRDGSATELAEGHGGVQVPASTPLKRRDNVAVALALPLEAVGLKRTEVSSEARWRSSRVLDPVTGTYRAASGEVPGRVSVSLAHALPGHRLSIGVSSEFTDAHTAYQLNQISTTGPGTSLGAFMSYTPGSYAVDFKLSGLLGSTRTEYQYRGVREASKLDRILPQRRDGPMLSVSLHKPF